MRDRMDGGPKGPGGQPMKVRVGASQKRTRLRRTQKWVVDTITLEEYKKNIIPPLMRDENLSKILNIYTHDLFLATNGKILYEEMKALTKAFRKMEDKEKIIPILEVMRQYHDSKIIPFVLLHAVEKHAPELTYLATKAILKYPSDPLLLVKFYKSRLHVYPTHPVTEAVVEFFKGLPKSDFNAVTTFKIKDKDLEVWINRNWRIPVNQKISQILLAGFESEKEREIARLLYVGRHYEAFVRLHGEATDLHEISEDLVDVVEQFTWKYRVVPQLNLNLYELFRFYWGFRKALGKAIYANKKNPELDLNIAPLVRLVSLFEQIIDEKVSEFYKTHKTMFGEALIANTERLKKPLFIGVSKKVYLDELLAAIATIVTGGKYPVYSVNRKIEVWYPEGEAKKSASARFKSIMEFLLENRSDKVTVRNKIIPEAERIIKLGADINETWRVSRRVSIGGINAIKHSYTASLTPPPLAIEFGTYAGFSFRVVNYFTLPWELVALREQ